MSETVEIYGLTCPTQGDIRYIGKANRAKSRLAQHLRESRRRTPVYDWIGSLRKDGLSPGMVILETCAHDQWKEAERRIIAEYRANGARLLNIADGGDEPYCSPEVRSANGKKVAAMRASDPQKAWIYETKKMLGTALKRGHLKESTKEKMRQAARINPALFGSWANI